MTAHRVSFDTRAAVALGVAAALSCLACPPPTFVHSGPESRQGASAGPGEDAGLLSSALPAPRIAVTPADALAGRFTAATVIEHVSRPVDGSHRLTVTTDDGARVAVTYDLTPELRIPADAGARIRLRLYEGDRSDDARALVVAAEDGRALAVIARHDGLPPGVLPAETLVRRAKGPDHIAFTEVRETPTGCFARLSHHDLEISLEQPRRVLWVAPGTTRLITVAQSPFLFLAYDASVGMDTACDAARLAHLSYALVAHTPTSETRAVP